MSCLAPTARQFGPLETTGPPLTAAFRPGVRPFYEALGFRVVTVPDGDRLVGWRQF